jgi:mitogen-activated protein kinase 15
MNKVQSKKINPLVNEIFPDEDLKHKYKVKKIIGKGQFGYVAKAVQKKTNEFVAIKKIINVFQNES